ncbi:MAG TPA: hypothetical protein VK502_04035 [Candidatus Saccharimonadales bacterium]|nr:hypothetical protein [Candidatus Saccharimonadales bacterium]
MARNKNHRKFVNGRTFGYGGGVLVLGAAGVLVTSIAQVAGDPSSSHWSVKATEKVGLASPLMSVGNWFREKFHKN